MPQASLALHIRCTKNVLELLSFQLSPAIYANSCYHQQLRPLLSSMQISSFYFENESHCPIFLAFVSYKELRHVLKIPRKGSIVVPCIALHCLFAFIWHLLLSLSESIVHYAPSRSKQNLLS